ncbi:RDD family protein [Streptomyces sp. NPDC048297]|uniref:RDD family protein n=1 Tax=Streptomyces sp. NPDC048297 TaxID=3365531 RepID=UPI00372492E8
MSAPTPAPGDDRPREGYYPDPSIPGYVRYWNGASWVPGTSRPAPKDGEPLAPPPGVRPAAPAVEETGPHFFDEDPQPGPSGQQQAWAVDPRIPAEPAGHDPGAEPVPAGEDPAGDPGGTFVFRRPVQGPAAVQDEGTMTFRATPGPQPGGPAASGTPGFGAHGADPRSADSGPAFGPQTSGPGAAQGSGAAAAAAAGPGTGGPGAAGPGAGGFGPAASGPGAQGRGAQGPGVQGQGAQGPVAQSPGAHGAGAQAHGAVASGGFGAQGPVGAPAAQSGPPAAASGFAPGSAAAARGATAPPPGTSAASAVAPSVPQQGGPQPGASAPVTSGPGGGQASWAQQVHQLAGGADEQSVAPWKPVVEDPFQAVAQLQASARPAGLGRRLAARLIDSVVLGAVTAAVAVPLGTGALDHVQHKIDEARLSGRTVTVWLLDGTTGTALGIVLAVLLLFGVVYEVLPTAKWGRTLGKKLCGVDVRDIEGHEPPTFGAALRRWLVYSIPGLLGIGIVGVLWCLFDRPWHQCWHDKAAHTFVAG